MSDEELVRAAAEKVMGWEEHVPMVRSFGNPLEERPGSRKWWRATDGSRIEQRNWNPLENIADAWMLVEKLRPILDCFELGQFPDGYTASYVVSGENAGEMIDDTTAPRVIVRACLAACGVAA